MYQPYSCVHHRHSTRRLFLKLQISLLLSGLSDRLFLLALRVIIYCMFYLVYLYLFYFYLFNHLYYCFIKYISYCFFPYLSFALIHFTSYLTLLTNSLPHII